MNSEELGLTDTYRTVSIERLVDCMRIDGKRLAYVCTEAGDLDNEYVVLRFVGEPDNKIRVRL